MRYKFVRTMYKIEENFLVPSDAEKALHIAKISLPKKNPWVLAVFAKTHGFHQNPDVFEKMSNLVRLLKSTSVFSYVKNVVADTCYIIFD